MKKFKLNIKMMIAVAVLLIAIICVIIFGIKSHNNSKKSIDKNTNLLFEYYSNDMLVSNLDVELVNGKTNDVIVTMIYENNSIAKEIGGIYKDENEYSDIKIEGNKLIMHYNEKAVAELANLSKDELIERFKLQGYVYKK